MLLNVRRAPTRRMVIAKPTVLRGGALETESPGHYLNLPAGTSSTFSSGPENAGCGAVQTLLDHRIAGRRTEFRGHRAPPEGRASSRQPNGLEVLRRRRCGTAGSAGREWK